MAIDALRKKMALLHKQIHPHPSRNNLNYRQAVMHRRAQASEITNMETSVPVGRRGNGSYGAYVPSGPNRLPPISQRQQLFELPPSVLRCW